MQNFWRDLVYAARVLRHAPGFALITVTVLAMGIGANCAIFALVDAAMLGRCRSPIPPSWCSCGRNHPAMIATP